MATGISLHIGLNGVDPSCYDGSWQGTMVGAVQDAQDMYAIALTQGFNASQLLDGNATRQAVTEAIFHAATTLVTGDLFWLSYAGHGGRIRDLSGDESDFSDETWCLYDGHLLDDELHLLWSSFASGVRIFVVSDSCHSGTVTRDGSHATPRAMPDKVAVATWQQQRAFYLDLMKNHEPDKAIVASVRLFAACPEQEEAYDGIYDGTPNGYFTSAWKKVWDNGAYQGTYIDFFNRIYDTMFRYQRPEHSVIGINSSAFDQQNPLQI